MDTPAESQIRAGRRYEGALSPLAVEVMWGWLDGMEWEQSVHTYIACTCIQILDDKVAKGC